MIHPFQRFSAFLQSQSHLLFAVAFCCFLPDFPAFSAPAKSTTECIGSKTAKAFVVYLHGLAPPQTRKNEEGQNREILEKLSRDFSLRIALPRATLCSIGKLCWSGRDRKQVLQTFRSIREKTRTCWNGNPKYTLIGFSNGGYFALKLYKAHQDPQLTRIIALGSAGTWDPKLDKPNSYSSFHLVMGKEDVTLKETTRLAEILRKQLPGFSFDKFSGAHRLDYEALAQLLKRSAK